METPMALTDPWSGEDDDTDYDYYDTPSGNIRAGRVAALLFPSLIVRTWHHRPERGPVRPDKETA
jgi:hypothetical protein